MCYAVFLMCYSHRPDFIKAKLTGPKAILNRLTVDHRNVRIDEYESVVATEGDYIPLPSLKAVTNFITVN